MKQSIIKILAGAITLAAFIVLGRTSYSDHVELAKLRAKYDGAASVQVVAVTDAQGHKLGAALVPQRAGDFFVSPTAASPFAIKDGSSVTRDTFDTTHGRITAGSGGTDGSVVIGPYTGAGADPSIYMLPNGVAAGGSNWGILGDGTNLDFNTVGATGNYQWFNANFTLLATMSQAAFSLSANVTGMQVLATNATNIFNGAVRFSTIAKSANYTIDGGSTLDFIVLVDTSGGVVTITLPAPSNGRVLLLIDSTNSFATHNCTLARPGTQNIDAAAANKTLSTAGQRVFIWSDGTNYFTLSGSHA